MRIGLTGGVASGKSTVSDMFAELGVPIIDTDIIAREVVEPGQPALRALVEAFGADILDSRGRLDRQRMRNSAFGDESKRLKLEEILHPVIARQMLSAADRAGGRYQVLVIPLLVETGMSGLVDRILVVDCPPEVQLERLLSRDDESETGARRILEAQADRARRLAEADDVLVNDGDLDNLRASVRDLHRAYLTLPV